MSKRIDKLVETGIDYQDGYEQAKYDAVEIIGDFILTHAHHGWNINANDLIKLMQRIRDLANEQI
jgi:hypothetical protein